MEFGAENDVPDAVFAPDALGISHRNGRFDDHEDVGVDFQCPFDGVLHCGGVKKVVDVIVVCGGGDNDQICVAIGGCLVCGRVEVQSPLPAPCFLKKSLDLIILDRADKLVEIFSLFLRRGDGGDLMLLGEEDCEGESDISYSCDCDLHIWRNLVLSFGSMSIQ